VRAASSKEASVSTLVQHVVAALRQHSAERRLALNLEFWDGHRESLGGPANVTLRLNRPEAALRLLRPDLGTLGQAYVDGDIDVVGPTEDVVRLAVELSRGFVRERLLPWFAWRPWRHSVANDARAIAHHYDVSNDFYRLWLDREMVYSCAFFHRGDESLDEAQQNKLDLICRKLQLERGEQLLDIGCGWGALLFWAQRHYGVKAVGVTLSTRQFEYVRDRIDRLGLAGEVEVHLQDYRQIPGRERFDKIASVGMFEHVGLKNLPLYFAAIHRLLKRGGLVLNHGITTATGDDAVREAGGEFIERYVFPGGELPEVARAMAEMAGQNLEVFDVEGLRPHYAQTLMHWVTRLEARREEAIRLVGEKTYRVWRIYMAGSAHAFERGWISVYQLLAAKGGSPGFSAQAWSRDHMVQAAPANRLAARPLWPNGDAAVDEPQTEPRCNSRAAR
jgi:cyclopropane-fatty-acyl-phospholipid synthase